MDTSLNGMRSGKNWLIVGLLIAWLSALMGVVSYVSMPPTTLLRATGKVVSVNYRYPSRSPKINIYIDGGHGVLHLYTDLGVIQPSVVIGDVIEAKFDTDIFGRNFHRFWDLRRGDEVLLSEADSFPKAEADAHQIGWLAFFGFAASLVVLAVGARLRAPCRAVP